LFGSLNPLGNLTAEPGLLATNITIGAGAIQFVLQGVKDAEDLIRQLDSNPLLQAELMSTINKLLARA
jgi:hypothetical protein